tara:strand:- start:5721 stop:6809 length:1089 start_codon:yes stop_codon:yes gene_type:complete
MDNEFIKIENLSVIFEDGTVAADNVNISINEKEFLVLVGPSGCGKSTILRSVVGLQNINTGKIYIDKKDITHLSPRDRDIAMIFQSYALYPHMTVRENLSIPLKLKKIPKEEIVNKINEISAMLSIDKLLDRYPRALSGGQKQRVAMGRALIRKPRVFLMDEPLSNLDAQLRVEMRSQISILQKKLGVTTIYVTHDQVEAMTMGDRVAIINDGKLVQIDKPSNLYNKPINTFVASFIGSPKINFFDINHIIKFNNDKNNKLNDYLKNYNKTDLLLGVRPEDLTTDDKKDSLMIEVNPILIEDLGFSKDIIFSLSEIENENNFIARLSSESQIGSNDKIKLFFPINKLVVFNKNTNERINLDA